VRQYGEDEQRSERQGANDSESNPEKRTELARISHHLTVEARNRPAITSLRLLAVLNVLSEYASARQAARASY